MTFDLRAALLQHLDSWWGHYRQRLDGLTDEEHLWSPVEGWTVRQVQGVWTIDPIDRDADPAPFTSVAWRMWHIAADCLDAYSMRAFGSQAGPDDMGWYGTASEALARTDASWSCFRTGMAGLDLERLQTPLGPDWGEYAEHSYAALALHAHAEVTHHGAEVALLRDLYRATVG